MKNSLLLFVFLFSPLVMTSEDELFINAISILNKMHEELSEKHLLAKIELLKKERDKHIDNPIAVDFISQELSVYYSFLGEHSLALVDNAPSNYQSVLPKALSPIDAVDYISEKASSLQIVMVNEAHNVAQHRVLTYQLLDKLWKHGYRYFAVEALSNEINELLEQGYLKNSIGYYTRETIFANLLLKARTLGFKIISYDQHKSGDQNTIEERETNAALSIQELIFDKDPEAKVIFHVGYSHIDESSKWLASELKKRLKLELLTVDQTRLTEKAKREDESDAYLQAQAKIKTNQPVIFWIKQIESGALTLKNGIYLLFGLEPAMNKIGPRGLS